MRRLRLAVCGAIAVGIFAASVGLVGCDSGCPEGQDLTVTNWVHHRQDHHAYLRL